MNTELPKAPVSPGRLLIFLTVIIFLTELVLMAIFNFVTDWPLWLETVMDAFLLIAVAFPALYFYMFRPLVRQASEIRAEEQELLKGNAALMSAANAIFITDTEGLFEWVNPAFTQLTGYTEEEVIGKTPRILKSGQMGEDYYRRMWGAIKRGDVWHTETINKHKDGKLYTIDQTVTPVKDSMGKITSFVAIQIDVSERIRALESERRESALDQTILSSIGDGLILVDQDGGVVRVNRMFEQMTGYTIKDFAGRQYVEVVKAKDASGEIIPKEKRLIPRVMLEHPGLLEDKYALIRKDGTTLDVSVIVSPVILEGQFIGAVQVYRDITKEQAVDRAKTEFVSMASHQLRTPLSTIKWYTEMLLAGDVGLLTDKQKEYLNEVFESNSRMISLVNSLLNVSRIETGILLVELQETDVADIVRSVLHELESSVTEKHLMLRRNIAEHLPKIQADPRLLRMVVQNLLTNAIKYTAPNGIITVTLSGSGYGIHFDVADTGMGIPKGDQPRIFTKLYRADNARKMAPDGNGLGLYIAKSIMDQTGGTIRFESEEGKGTTFYVTLPLSGMNPKTGTKGLV